MTQDALAHRAGVFSAGGGYLGDGWLGSLLATHRHDGDSYRQTDWTATIEWRGDAYSVGLDGSYRHARQQGTVAAPNPPAGTAWVPVAQRVEGGGIGVHGGASLGAKGRLYASAMRYDYRSRTRQNGEVSNGGGNPGGLVGALLGNPALLARALSTRASLVARDEVALARSAMVGASYRVAANATVAAEVLGDQVLDTPGTVRTAQLKAALDVAPGWQLTPAVGRTRSDGYGGVNFGALSASYAW